MSVHSEYLLRSARTSFLSLFADSDADVVLVVEPCLIDAIDVLFKFSELEAKGVKSIIPWTPLLEAGADSLGKSTACTRFIFFCLALGKQTLPLIAWLGDAVSGSSKSAVTSTNATLVFSPFVPESALSSNAPPVKIISTDSLLLSVLEDDTFLLPLGGEDLFADFHCRADPSLLCHVAHALKHVQSAFGVGLGEVEPGDRKICKISSIGTAAKYVADSFVSNDSSGCRIFDETRSDSLALENCQRSGIHCVGPLVRGPNACNVHAETECQAEQVLLSASDAIGSMVLIDRRSDLFSVLCSQFTYEALIDDEIGIKNRRVKFSSHQKDQGSNSSTTSMILSKSLDHLFGEIRDVSVSHIGQLLSKKANFIAECYKEKDALKSISEIKDFMETFKEIQVQHSSLTNHVSLATIVSDLARDPHYMQLLKLEDQIMSMAKPVAKILSKLETFVKRSAEIPLIFTLERILKLLSLTTLVFGPKPTTHAGLDKTVRSIVHQFGFDAIPKIHHLEQCGLLKFHNPAEAAGVMSELMSSGSKWPKIREEFKLISTEPSEELAQAYSGYIPISVRLVQLLNASWKTSADKLNLLRGPALEIQQECPVAPSAPGNTMYVLVVFIGGVTYGEIAALRKLSELEAGKRKFLILATGITSYRKIIHHM